MVVGYARVSTEEQNEERQIKLLTETYQAEKIYIDKASGKTLERPQFNDMLNFLRAGDTLVVESYSRLARTTKGLFDTIDFLAENGVALISDKEKIDTTTPQGKLILTIFAGLAEFEREIIRQRQAEGVEVAKAKGMYKGRRRLPYDKVRLAEVYELWRINHEITAVEAQQMLGMKPHTFYRRVKEYEIDQGIIPKNKE